MMMKMIDEFNQWIAANRAYMGKVRTLLEKPMPDQEEALLEHLRLVEAHYARMGCLLAEVNSILDRAISGFYQINSGREWTVNEKKAACDSEVSQVREARDKVVSIEEAISTRISLGQSIMKQQRGERMNASHTS